MAILGATGSIGRQTLDVIDRNPDRFTVFGLASRSTPIDRPARFVATLERDGAERLEEMVTHPDCDLVVVAISGSTALRPTLAALGAGKAVAIATKEVLVMAGELVMQLAGPDPWSRLRPVDSEHSAIWQCLWGESPDSVRRIVLTASGGPFWGRPGADLNEATVEQALAHPRWRMGPKVTIDSATLMNKGLELIEAHHLFRTPLDRIEVAVHPQSVIHSMVEFVDGSIKAQLGSPDMRLPIAVALSYPERLPAAVPATDLIGAFPLELHRLDPTRFPAVELARQAAAAGRGYPAVLNAANEEAVELFLRSRIRLPDIVALVADCLDAFPGCGPDLDEIIAADRWARDRIKAANLG